MGLHTKQIRIFMVKKGKIVITFADIDIAPRVYICTAQSGTALSQTESLGCTVGWVNLSEFEITVCGSCKM